ncbi:putative endonuclease 4 [Bacilli bacterium]|nr:putative endonuclease 4 [Bacilli bacterium]
MTDILLGSHVSMAKPDYLLGSLNTALSYGSNTFMIYTGAPQNSIRTALSLLHIEEFKQNLKEHHIDINHLVVHAPYIVNIGTSDARRNAISVQTLKTEVYRTHAIGCRYLVLHPGNATGNTREEAITNIANSINEINKDNHGVVICLETMSGKGSEIGRTLEELSVIINHVHDKHLIGVCIDTCHINDAGYSIAQIDQFLNDFDRLIGLSYLKVIHLNDSKNGCNAHKDRHENIGYGTIGFNNLLK